MSGIDAIWKIGHDAQVKALLFVPLLALAGCMTVAKTAVDVVTLPVKVVAAGVDAATTSQSDADEKRGRDLRKAEEAAGRRDREWQKACEKARQRGNVCPPRPDTKL